MARASLRQAKMSSGGRQGSIHSLPAARCPETLRTSPFYEMGKLGAGSFLLSTLNYQPPTFQVDMMELGEVQLLAPVLPPMARARTV